MAGLERLEFLLDLDAKVDGAVKLLGVLDESIKSFAGVDRNAAKLTNTMDRLDKTSRHGSDAHHKHAGAALNLGHAFESAKDKAHGLLEAMGLMLLFEGVEKVTEKVMELGGEILAAAAKAERAELSFKLLLGDKGGEELLGYVEGISKFTEFTDDELKGMTQGLLKAGFAAKEIPRALAGALDIASFSANAVEGMAGALTALERIRMTGNVDKRVLRGMGFGEKDFLKELSDRTGTGVATLKKQLDKGKVDVSQSVEALYSLIHKRTGKDLGGAGVDMSKTLGARMKHLKDLPDQFFQGLAKTSAFHSLSDSLGGLLEMLSPESDIGARLATSLETLFTKAVAFINTVDFDKWGDRFIDFLDKLPERLEVAGEILSVFGNVFKAVGGFVFDLGEEIGRLAAVIYLAPGKIYDAAADIGKAVWQGLKDGITGGVASVMSAVGEMGDAVVGKLKGILGIHSPSTVFEKLGEMSGAGYIQGLEGSMDGMSDSVPTGAFTKPAAGGAGAGAIHVVINVNMAGGHGGGEASGAEIGQQIAQHIEGILPGALQSAFQRMQQEAGA